MTRCLLAVLILMLLPAVAQAQTITLVNHANLSQHQIHHFERAAITQSAQLHLAWHTSLVRFGPNGWHMVLKASYVLHHGWHGFMNKPLAYVQVFKKIPWTVIASHELMEMLEDPYGGKPEVCDPVEGQRYWIDGILMARFVGPTV